MACATLKRSLDFDPVHHHVNPTKRQRFFSPPSTNPMNVSPSSSPPHSVFNNVCPRMSADMMSASIIEQIRRLHRKKRLFHHSKSTGSTSPPDTASDSSSSSFSSLFSASNSPDKPLFTFRQVGLICEHLVNERENEIREEYDRFLYMKLSEQYEAFVKYSNDQLQKRFDGGPTPSYLS